MDLLPALQKEFPAIDPRRLYVTGASMGGFGTWDLLARRPDWFAAAVPIDGGADLETAATVAPVPIWAFHGAQDGAIRPERSRTMIAALADVGGEPRYTEYPAVGRNAWKRAYAEPDLLSWLFAQRRSVAGPPAPTNLKAAVVGSDRVDLSWTPSRDSESAIKEYRILRDGAEFGMTVATAGTVARPTLRFTDTEIGEGEVHSYSVVAVNHAWLKSAPTPQVWAKSPPDRSPLRVVSVLAQGSPVLVRSGSTSRSRPAAARTRPTTSSTTA